MTAIRDHTPHPRPRLGLALGSGAALGAAHAGVIQALDQAGIRVDIVAGSSAGALLGGGYAAGLAGEELVDLVLKARWSTFARWRASGRLGLLGPTPMDCSIEDRVGPRLIEDLPLPFAAIAFDVGTRNAVSLTTGPLAQAVRAACAVPGLFPPVHIDGRWLIDGALAASVPVAAARAVGAERIIAVNPVPPSRTRMMRRRLPRPRSRGTATPSRRAAAPRRVRSPALVPLRRAAGHGRGQAQCERAYVQIAGVALRTDVSEPVPALDGVAD